MTERNTDFNFFDPKHSCRKIDLPSKFRQFSIITCLFICFFGGMNDLSASHFRGGTITYQETGNPNEIQFTITTSWRYSFFNGSVGSTINPFTFQFGDNSSTSGTSTVTAVNTSENWLTCVAVLTHTYSSNGSYTAFFDSCCRLGTLGHGNGNSDYRMETLVNIGPPYAGNIPPVASTPTIINMAANSSNATFQIPGVDPDGDPITYRLATSAESGLPNVDNDGKISVGPTGILTFNTTGLATEGLYATAIIIEDRVGSVTGAIKTETSVDLFIRLVGSSQPPVFIAPTPASGTVFNTSPGTNLTININANDPDGAGNPGGDVLLQVNGLPATATFTPALPTPAANPVVTQISWTPTAAEVGTYVAVVLAQDDLGIQTTTNFTVNVSAAPTFDSPPTPSANSYFCNSGGQNISYTLQATDLDIAETVSLTASIKNPASVTMPTPAFSTGGMAFKTTLPNAVVNAMSNQSATANVVSTPLNWNVSNSEWGIYEVEYTATNGANKSSKILHTYIIDRAPTFVTATPNANLQAIVGQPFSFTITATDLDIPLGDAVNFADATKPYVDIPSWCTLTDNLDGTATLSGTPIQGDVGIQAAKIEIHDRTTHYNHTHCTWAFMNFNVEVIDCTIAITNVATTNEGCPDADDGTITATATCASCANGAADIRYSLDNTDFTNTTGQFTGLADGTYTIYVRDLNDVTCTAMQAGSIIAAGIDSTPPIAVCQDVTVTLDANGMGSITPAMINNGSLDNCTDTGDLVLSLDDMSFECADVGTQTVTLTVEDEVSLTHTCTSTVTVLPPAHSVSITDATLVEGDSGSSNMSFILTRTNAVCATTVDYTTTDGTAMISNNDYTATSGTVTFAAGELMQTILVPILGDEIVETNETFVINLSSPGANLTIASAQATGTITNDDFTDVAIAATIAPAGEPMADGEFTVSMGLYAQETVVVDYTIAGTAANGTDYQNLTGQVIIPAGSLSAMIAVDIVDDLIVESDETVDLTLTGTDNVAITVDGTMDNAVVAILEDDAALITISGDPQVLEGNSGTQDLVFTITLDNATQDPFTIDLNPTDGQATAADNDYIDITTTINFAGISNEQQQGVIVINGDTQVEGNEFVWAVLENIQAGCRHD